MGRKVLIAAICWLTLSAAAGEPGKIVKSSKNSKVRDNVSAESAQRLYKSVPIGMYASAAPYAAYSFPIPSVIKPQAAGSQHFPVKAASVVVPSLINLKDSYGKLVASPQTAAFKTAFPQQYVQLQELPPHLAQPLVSASPSFQFKAAPNYFFGPQSYKVPALQLAPGPTPISQVGGHYQPLIYAGNIQSLAPPSNYQASSSNPSKYQVSSSNPSKYQVSSSNPSKYQASSSNPSKYHVTSSNPSNYHSTNSNPSNYQVTSSNPSNHQVTSSNPSNYQATDSNSPNYQVTSSNPSNYQATSSNPSNYQVTSSNPSIYQVTSSNPSNYQVSSSKPSTSTVQITKEPTFQEINEQLLSKPVKTHKDAKQQASHRGKVQIQAAPAQTSVTAIVNGKKTVVTLDTKPPLPLLDLNLLEPLKFDNPLVPQIQNFLPKIPSATYYKLPTFNINEGKKKQKDVVVTKTKSYDSGYTKQKPKKKQNKPSKPGLTVIGHPNGGDYFYEINTPNHKETYNEQVVKYNKETNMKPVEFSYNEQSHKEPEVYTFVHSSKEPLKVTHVEYDSDSDSPKQLVYTNYSPELDEEDEDDRRPSSQESDDSVENFDESEEEGPAPQIQHKAPKQNYEAPKRQKVHKSPKPTQNVQNVYYNSPSLPTVIYSGHPKQVNVHSEHSNQVPKPTPAFQFHPGLNVLDVSPKPPQQQYVFVEQLPTQFNPNVNYQVQHENSKPSQHHDGHKRHNDSPKQSHHLKAEHRGQPHKNPPKQIKYEMIQSTPKYFPQPVTVNVQNAFQPIVPEYNEDIRLLPTHAPHAAAIKVNPNQHIQFGPTTPQFFNFNLRPSNAPQMLTHRKEQEPIIINSTPRSFSEPHIEEKSKHVIIQEEEETPDVTHTHTEQAAGEMVKQEENNEEDFEKAYKESAFGFPAYDEKSAENIEKDIYNPESYGEPRQQDVYNIEDSPFQQYTRDGDVFPKSARLAYKDSRDSNKEDYYSEFAVNKPTSYADRIKNQVDYYKMFKKHRPGKVFYEQGSEDEEGKKEKKNEKYTVDPSFFEYLGSSKPKAKQSNHLAEYKAAPIKYEFDYSKEPTHDSISYASKPFRRTHFVEPQFQYGFEPLATPIVVDSELAAMASNDNPESEKPGTRKKIYKENWYIKKTSTTGSKAR